MHESTMCQTCWIPMSVSSDLQPIWVAYVSSNEFLYHLTWVHVSHPGVYFSTKHISIQILYDSPLTHNPLHRCVLLRIQSPVTQNVSVNFHVSDQWVATSILLLQGTSKPLFFSFWLPTTHMLQNYLILSLLFWSPVIHIQVDESSVMQVTETCARMVIYCLYLYTQKCCEDCALVMCVYILMFGKYLSDVR